MNLQPARGYIYITPVDEIPSSKSEVGFGAKTDKFKPEQPYKFRVAAVGAEVPQHNMMIPSEVKVGDVISLIKNNATLREQRGTSGFLVDGSWYLPIDFSDVFGIWRGDEEIIPSVILF